MSISLSRNHFKKGFDDTLTLKHLREAVGLAKDKGQKVEQGGNPRTHSVIVVRTRHKTWNVKQAS